MTSLYDPIKLILEFYYMSNGLTFEIYFCDIFTNAKFQGDRFIIDGEINKKHALQIYQNNIGPGYSEPDFTSQSPASNLFRKLIIPHYLDYCTVLPPHNANNVWNHGGMAL